MLSQIWIFDHKIFECCMFVDYQDEICDDIFVNNWNKFPSYDDKNLSENDCNELGRLFQGFEFVKRQFALLVWFLPILSAFILSVYELLVF